MLLGVAEILTLAFVAMPAQAGGYEVRDEGIRAFWKLHETWTADGIVTQPEWEALFQQPGYKQIDAVERRSSWMQPIFELALRPSQDQAAKQRIAKGDMIGRLLIPYMQQLRSRRERISGLSESLKKRGIVQKAINAARKYLPTAEMNFTVVPPVCLVIIDGDSKALDDAIVVDAATLSFLEAPELLIGHELHHYFRRLVDRVPLASVAEQDRAFVTLLVTLEEEGIADLVDKRDFVLSQSELNNNEKESPLLVWMWGTYMEIFKEVASLIRDLDAGLCSVADDAAKSSDEGKRLSKRLLRLSGRPVGMFMANVIDVEFGADRVKSLVRNPFAFIRTYAEAASKKPTTLPQISAKALSVVTKWEREYLK